MNGNILTDAHTLINAQRQDDYGRPATSFQRIATMWSAYLGRDISSRDVACLMALLKLAREAKAHKRDNLLDAAGYIGLAADMAALEYAHLADEAMKRAAAEVLAQA